MSLTGKRLILLIGLFMFSCFYMASQRSPLQNPFAAASMVEGVGQETAAKIEPVAVNPVGKTGANVPLNRNVDSAKSSTGLVNSLDRKDVVSVAVNEKNRGAGKDVGSKTAGLDKQAGKADDSRHLPVAAKAGVKSHHGSLAKAHKGKVAVVKAKRHKLAVKEGVKHRRRAHRATPALPRVAKRKLKPLPATVWISPTDFWRMW